MLLTCPDCQHQVDYQWQDEIPDDEFAVIHCPQCDIDWRHTADYDVRVYWYVNRWYDEAGTPHYFGIQSPEPTLALAQQKTRFNAIATSVHLVYAASDLDDLHTYLDDVNRNPQSGNDQADIGTLGWME